ncbi:hypothetical protein OG909_26490 [Streptomyces sp. NBC_01754]|uniref:hypothetical protein n=1 Tax=Streptomyces sp. NBC_01754 TaxID=2975930 RepID=UPI002DDB99CD|nr:hypothetical protein [Streptomyces sp. NBC_01754]WSC95553.1 hypothetical protein OG909_26490 [Streptomyces sp. NBC_01754]
MEHILSSRTRISATGPAGAGPRTSRQGLVIESLDTLPEHATALFTVCAAPVGAVFPSVRRQGSGRTAA